MRTPSASSQTVYVLTSAVWGVHVCAWALGMSARLTGVPPDGPCVTNTSGLRRPSSPAPSTHLPATARTRKGTTCPEGPPLASACEAYLANVYRRNAVTA